MSGCSVKSEPIPLRKLLVFFLFIFGFNFLIAGPDAGEVAKAAMDAVDGPAIETIEGAAAITNEVAHGVTALSDNGLGAAPAPPTQVAVGRDSLWMTLAILIGVLLLVVVLLLFISANLVNLIRVREGKEAYSLSGTLALTKEYLMNPYINSMGAFVSVIIALFIVVPIARGVGLSQGYQPDQPIWFSHKIHAGENKIDCQYCHTGASKGKNAWIPSVNVCMNCHKGIQEGSRTGTEEIAKITFAYENDMPIEWVRIHNLPDLAYFNHQQHVVAGKQECETCHGPIAEMDVVYQFAPLSMGWCINCHRETDVNAELYEKLGRDDVHKVEDIGGLDCARCHY